MSQSAAGMCSRSPVSCTTTRRSPGWKAAARSAGTVDDLVAAVDDGHACFEVGQTFAHGRQAYPQREQLGAAPYNRTMSRPDHEIYTHSHRPIVLAAHGRRTAEEAAAFLLPHLEPGM